MERPRRRLRLSDPDPATWWRARHVPAGAAVPYEKHAAAVRSPARHPRWNSGRNPQPHRDAVLLRRAWPALRGRAHHRGDPGQPAGADRDAAARTLPGLAVGTRMDSDHEGDRP